MRSSRGLLAACALAALFPAAAAAQATGTVTGQVVESETNQPVPGAQVYIEGAGIGQLTNQLGRYQLVNVPTGTHEIRVRLIGYTQQSQSIVVTATAPTEVDFQLRRSAIELNPVVINAITGQEQRTRELGTNVGNIDVENLPLAQVTSIADVLTARTAGVNLQSVAGTIGTTQRIRIRGANSLSLSNEPLVYVDGVLISTGADPQFDAAAGQFYVGGQEPGGLNDINPENIESIEILKGPAASALYGTAAANGVVLITTKRGRSGDARWQVYAEAGRITDPTDYPLNYYTAEILDPDAPFAFLDLEEVGAYYGFPASALQGVYGFPNFFAQAPCSNFDAADGLCTQDTTVAFNTLADERTSYFQDGLQTRYGLNVSGGSDRLTYYLSGDLSRDEGIISYNEQDRVSLRANMQAAVTPQLTVNITSAYATSELSLPNNDNSIFSPLINGLIGSPFYVPDLDDPEIPAQVNYGFFQAPRDLAALPQFVDADRFTIGANATYTPLDWLTANANAGLDLTSNHLFATLQPDRLPIAAFYAAGYRQSSRGSDYVYTANASGVARYGFRENLMSTTTLGGSFQRSYYRNTYCFGSGLVTGLEACDATTSLFAVDEDFTEVITIGGFLREEIAINDRLFLAASIRGDDNSAFGRDFGWIYYPSVSASWVVAEEGWFPRTPYVSNLRLRAAYGESGLRPTFRDAQTLYTPTAVTRNQAEVPGVSISNLGNPNLKPERSREIELGFDLGVLDDRLGLDFTYYVKRSKDALIERNVAPSAGFQETVFQNLGEIRNSGIELELQARAFETENATLNVRFSATTLENEIVELGEGVTPIIFNDGVQRHQEGLPAGAFYARPYTYEDADDNGLLSVDEVDVAEDQVLLGPPLPTNTQSLSLDLTLFRYLRVNTLFDRRAGSKQLNTTEYIRCNFGYNSYGGLRGCAGVADPNASLEEQARFIANFFGNTYAGYVEDADFIKWRELSITLSAPPALTQNLRGLDGVSLTLAGRNLATWTDYTGLDPEINETGGDANFSQNELATQPPLRFWTARINFSF